MGHIHSDSEYDYTASAMIVHQNKVLLLLHHKLHLWLPPAGHIELDETPIEALYREVEEETGLTQDHLSLVNPFTDNLALKHRPDENQLLPVPFNLNTHTVTSGGHRHIDLSYILASNTDKVTKEDGGAEKLDWFTLDELRELSPLPKLVFSHAEYALEKVREFENERL